MMTSLASSRYPDDRYLLVDDTDEDASELLTGNLRWRPTFQSRFRFRRLPPGRCSMTQIPVITIDAAIANASEVLS